jgi:hypothetical protein
MENQVLAWITSFVAMIFVVLAYFVKKKEHYLLFQLLCIIFLILSYFFSLEVFAMVGLSIGLCRSLIFFIYEKKDLKAPIEISFVLSALTIASYLIINIGIQKNAKIEDVFCMSGLVMYAFIFRIRDLKTVRYLMIIPTVLSVLYNLLIVAPPFTVLTYGFELGANVVSIFKYHVIPERKEAKNKQFLGEIQTEDRVD